MWHSSKNKKNSPDYISDVCVTICMDRSTIIIN